jgi:Gpi18-like mannosyltransferase
MIKKLLGYKFSQETENILLLFFGWRVTIILIAFLGLSFLPYNISPGFLTWSDPGTDYWINWANWDGGHFRSIAEIGYKENQVVFFPLYPLLIKLVTYTGTSSLWAGLIISNLCIIFALYFLYKLTLLDYPEEHAKKVIFFLLAFPTAFYFGAVYSESLFLFLTVASFYCARKKLWLLSLVLAGLSSATRLVGLFVILSVAIEYYLKISPVLTYKQLWNDSIIRYLLLFILIAFLGNLIVPFLSGDILYIYLGIWSFIYPILLLAAGGLALIYVARLILKSADYKKILTATSFYFFISLIPLLAYLIYLYFTQNDFLAFMRHESAWGRHLDFPWRAPWFYAEQLFRKGFFRPGLTGHILLEFLTFIFFLVLLIVSYIKLRLSYTVFFLGALLLPLSSGTLVSIHRYGLIIFPIFILMALVKNQALINSWIYFSLMLQGLLLVLFFNSYWVT